MSLIQPAFRWLTCTSILVACLAPALASAQVRVQVGLPLPELSIQVGGPLVYVGPQVWVLPDSDDEVFYSGGWYWARNNGHWYRSHGRQRGWAVVNESYVPAPVRRLPPGQYRRFHAPEHAQTMAPRGWQEQRGPRREREQPAFQPVRRQESVMPPQGGRRPPMFAPQGGAPIRRGPEPGRGQGGGGESHGREHGGGQHGH